MATRELCASRFTVSPPYLSLRQTLRACHLPRQREARRKTGVCPFVPRPKRRGFTGGTWFRPSDRARPAVRRRNGVSAETPAIRRELSPQATEGENSQSVCSGHPALRLRGGERFRACGRGERRPLSTGGKWTERPPGGFYTKGEMPPDPPFAVSEDGFCCTQLPLVPRPKEAGFRAEQGLAGQRVG